MRTLVFSIGLNGYDIGYRSCLKTQEEYARRLNADFRVATKPSVDDPALAAWLKVPLLLRAISSGYDRVAYIDADCRVSEGAPDFRDELESSLGQVCMALGRTSRLNSGVIFAANSDPARVFLTRVMESVTLEIPEQDRANLRFENGNIIYVNSRHGGVHVLSQKWNNSSDPNLEDYIRHFTGPMKGHLKAPPIDRLRYRWSQLTSPRSRPAPQKRSDEFKTKLESLADEVYDNFGRGRSL